MFLLGLLLLITVLGALTVLGAGRTITITPSHLASPSSPAHPTPMATTQYGGDLTVPSGVNLTLGPATGRLTYYEGGNLTVAAGGTLNVRNTTIVFVEFIGNGGSVASQLSHIYHLLDAGTMVLTNSSITTLVTQIDPYPILTVTITGSFQMTNGALAFPGSITINGSSANLWLSHSTVGRNPAASALMGNASSNSSTPASKAFASDVAYAPVLSVIGGGQATFLTSLLNNSFRDPLNGSTLPGVPPSTASPSAGNAVLGGTAPAPLVLPAPANSTDALALAAAYPTVASGSLSISYNSTAASTTSNSRIVIGPNSWTFNPIHFGASSGTTTVEAPVPAAAVASINQGGVPAFLDALGSGQVAIAFGTASTPTTIHSVTLSFVAGWSFNLTVSGSGSTLTAADTTFDENWNATPGLPGALPYFPWHSNKIVLTGGARAFLANVSVPPAAPVSFAHQSFVVPDAASSAAFYRWLNVPVRGAQGIIVQGATVQAPYAYSGATSENATVSALNNLGTADPTLGAYVAAWDRAAGVANYGEVDAAGNASLLLASGQLTNASLPDGNFLGSYHVGVTANPGSQGITQWFYASLPAYPSEMQPTGPNATGPVPTSYVIFPQYRVSVIAGSPTFAIGATPVTNGSTAIGENLSVIENVQSTGTGTVSSFTATLLLSAAGKPPVQIGRPQLYGPLAPGASHPVRFDWIVNGSLVGYATGGVLSTFTVVINWSPGAGAASAAQSLTIYPPYIAFSTTGPSGTLTIGNSYLLHAFVSYAGNGSAQLNITARSSTGGFLQIASGRVISGGETNVSVLIESSAVPGTYTLYASVFHDGRTVHYNVTNAFIIPSTAPPTTTPWYDQSFLGLALWLWLVIAAAIAAGIVLFLFVSVQKAKGKVVECGECGAMIPETAAACPECGAEFESDRVRCSRCGSTIPGNSAVCPECAATLLGRAGEEKDDPERQGYADFVERFRAEGRKALGDSYSESAFWDWWKRQSTYVPFGQWKMQQAQGSRAGMSAPRETATKEETPPPGRGAPPRRPPAARPPPAAAPPRPATPPPAAVEPAAPAAAPADSGMITCSNCHKEIPATYLVCPFCGAVTQ